MTDQTINPVTGSPDPPRRSRTRSVGWSSLTYHTGVNYPVEPQRLADWLVALCEHWNNCADQYIEDYWTCIDHGAEIDLPPADVSIPVTLWERSGSQPGELVVSGSSVWLGQHGAGIELGGRPRPTRPRPDPSMVARFMSHWEIRPLDGVLPDIRPPMACSTGASVGTCCLCGRTVLDYASKWTGWSIDDHVLLVHYECAQAHHGPTTEPLRLGVAEFGRARAYRRDLAKIRTPTLFSMLSAFELAPAVEQREHAWRNRIVRAVFSDRLDAQRDGDTHAVDARLAGAVDALDKAEQAT